MSFYFALTRWTLFDATFIGLDNFKQFFSEQALRSGLWHTLVYAVDHQRSEGRARPAASRCS